MMASLSSYWFLRRQGCSEYANVVKEDWLNMPEKADVPLLLASRRRHGWDLIFSGGEPYPPGFVASIGRIGYALNRLLDSDDLRHIIKAATLEEWIASLPVDLSASQHDMEGEVRPDAVAVEARRDAKVHERRQGRA